MDLLPIVQYWTLMLFLQFTPLNEVETGNKYQYVFGTDIQFTLQHEITEFNFNSENDIEWHVKSKFIGKDAPSNQLNAILSYNPVDNMHIKDIIGGKGDMMKNPILHFPDKQKEIIINDDENFKLLLISTSEETLTLAKNNKITVTKSVYEKDNLKIEVYHHEMHGLVKAIIYEPVIESAIIIEKK